MRALFYIGRTLIGAAALVGLAVGVTYLSVDAGSLPVALGKVAGSTAHFTLRGLFSVMVGAVLLLCVILLQQFRPGGILATPEPAVTTPPAESARPPAAVDQEAPKAADQAPPPGPDHTAPTAMDEAASTEYIGEMDAELETDHTLGLAARRREERRAVEEAGGGESEGFELAEAELIEHASHGDEHSTSRIMQDAVGPDEEQVDFVSGEADEEHLPD